MVAAFLFFILKIKLNTIFMPWILKKTIPWLIPAYLLMSIALNPLNAGSHKGITTYYIRFDTSSLNHKIINETLIMVPAESDYRSENFAQIPLSHVVSASPQTSNRSLENMVKKEAFIRLLEEKGLKSINTMNQNTVISYEGMVQIPVNIRIGPYDKKIGGYTYTAQIRFASLAFPDKWETLQQKFRVKEILNDFFLLFE